MQAKDEIVEAYSKELLSYIQLTKTTSVDKTTDFQKQQDIYTQYASEYDGIKY